MRAPSPRLALVLALVSGGLVAVPAQARTTRAPAAGMAFYDARDARGGHRAVAASARRQRARRALVRSIGDQGVLDVDPQTGTPRFLTRLDGTLTGPDERGPVAVALAYLREHALALGLTAADLDGLRLDRRATTGDGLTVLDWTQVAGGIPAFDSGVQVSVDRAGRVVAVSGSPAHDLGVASTSPAVPASAALLAARRAADAAGAARVVSSGRGPRRPARFADGSTAELVVFAAPGADRLAWDVVTDTARGLLHAAIDASSGRLLHRANLTKSVSANVFDNYPGAPLGGTVRSVDVTSYLTSSTTLTGPNAHAYSDLDDNNAAAPAEEVSPAGAPFAFTSFAAGSGCDAAHLCSWNSSTGGSWGTNREQNALQLFYYVNTFHDHLAAAPIGFDAAHGNFDATPGVSADPLIAENDDGATTGAGGNRPNADHVNNANMSTRPDGQSPRMQMYLFSDGNSASSSFRDVNGGDDAAIVYHEYTHGLSGRLITSGGFPALDTAQAGAMGEAWSDWYALDFLSTPTLLYPQSLRPDDPSMPGEVDIGAYVDRTPPGHALRSQAIDCPVGADATACPASGSAGSGGFTFGDFGRVCGCGPEVHADGEIWAQTLWDLRTALGSAVAEKLITDGMRLSPAQPSFLDARNAILAADTAATGGANRATIWAVFAARGMGFFAATIDSTDIHPAEDFSLPPASGSVGGLSGRVLDDVSGLPVAGAALTFAGQTGSAFTTTAGADGSYAFSGLPAGTYPRLLAGPVTGYNRQIVSAVTVTAGATNPLDMALRRDWAATPAGATLSASTGEDHTAQGCGPASVLDQSYATGWSTNNPQFVPAPGTPSLTVVLPQAITVTGFGIDPSEVCGDDESAALAGYRIETSPDGVTFTTAVDGASFAENDRARVNVVTPQAGTDAVRYVRLVLLSPQGPTTTDDSGHDFIDLAEFEVYGAPPNVAPSGALAVPATATTGQEVVLDASSFTDPDSAITGYAWDLDGDGVVDRSTTTPRTSFSYAQAGTFAPRVTVTDFRGGSGTAAASVVVSAPPVVVPPVIKPVRPKVGLPKQSANRASIRITCQSACTVTASIRVTKKVAKRLKLKKRVVGTVRRRLAAGTTTVRVPVTKAALRRLRAKRVRRVALALSVRAKDAAGLVTSAARTAHVPISKR